MVGALGLGRGLRMGRRLVLRCWGVASRGWRGWGREDGIGSIIIRTSSECVTRCWTQDAVGALGMVIWINLILPRVMWMLRAYQHISIVEVLTSEFYAWFITLKRTPTD